MTTNDSQNQDKKASPTESEEYKALQQRNAILQERIEELEALVKKDPELGFIKATDIAAQRDSNAIATSKQPVSNGNNNNNNNSEFTFPANKLSKFFLESRNVRQYVKVRIDNEGIVMGWEID